MTDINALIERWQGGDQRAAEVLYNHHRNQTFRLAYGLLGNQADAEEAAQDALTYALTNIRRYDSQRAGFGTWLHTITVSRCRDRQRAQRRRLASSSSRPRPCEAPPPRQAGSPPWQATQPKRWGG